MKSAEEWDREFLGSLEKFRAIQADALESAALACEPMTMTEEPYTSTAEECQAAIRALKP